MNLFGILITLFFFFVFQRIKLKVPTIVSASVCIILVLKIFKIDYEQYHSSASILSFLIAPATVAFAYPMYKNYHILIKNKRALYPALFVAAITAIISTYYCAGLLGADFRVIMSLMPKSTTMPIAVEISKSINGYVELTACIVALTGIFGGIFGHRILKFLKVKNDVAIGLALGSASHVIGTAACADRKKYKQTAAGTIALIIVGLLSAIIIPLFKNFY